MVISVLTGGTVRGDYDLKPLAESGTDGRFHAEMCAYSGDNDAVNILIFQQFLQKTIVESVINILNQDVLGIKRLESQFLSPIIIQASSPPSLHRTSSVLMNSEYDGKTCGSETFDESA